MNSGLGIDKLIKASISCKHAIVIMATKTFAGQKYFLNENLNISEEITEQMITLLQSQRRMSIAGIESREGFNEYETVVFKEYQGDEPTDQICEKFSRTVCEKIKLR